MYFLYSYHGTVCFRPEKNECSVLLVKYGTIREMDSIFAFFEEHLKD